MKLVHVAAVVGSLLLLAVIGFQLALAAGLPWGAAAWGGRHRVLPSRLRLGSAAAAVILVAAGWVLLARAGLVAPGAEAPAVRVAAWVLAALFVLSTLGNLASKSRIERRLMTPAAAATAACFLVVAGS
jgi:hypothetical protein